MYKPGILIQPLHIWLEISAAQYVWKQKAFAAFNFLIIPRCDKGKDQPLHFRWAVITACLMLWRSFFQKQSMCMFYLFFGFFLTFFKYSVQQKPVWAVLGHLKPMSSELSAAQQFWWFSTKPGSELTCTQITPGSGITWVTTPAP